MPSMAINNTMVNKRVAETCPMEKNIEKGNKLRICSLDIGKMYRVFQKHVNGRSKPMWGILE